MLSVDVNEAPRSQMPTPRKRGAACRAVNGTCCNPEADNREYRANRGTNRPYPYPSVIDCITDRYFTPACRLASMPRVTLPDRRSTRESRMNDQKFSVRLTSIDAVADLDILQRSLAFEHEGIAAYQLASASGLLTNHVLSVALLFKSHHERHRDALAGLVRQTGSNPVPPLSDDEYVHSLDLSKLRNQDDVLTLAARLEREAATAYATQVSAINDRRLAQIFAVICGDEIVHWTTLNSASGGLIPSRAFMFA